MSRQPQRKKAKTKGNKKTRRKKKGGKSITWVVTMASITVAVIGWCMLATAYVGYTEGLNVPVPSGRVRVGRGSGILLLVGAVARMIWDGVTQIPNVFSVIKFAFQERLGVVIGIVVLEVLLIVGGLGMKKLERDMENERKRY